MASTKAIVASLKILGRAFAGTVDQARAEVYAAALEDLTDEQLAAATVHIVKTHRGEFIPPPAVLRHAAGADQPPVFDVESVVHRVAQLAVYSPVVGMIYPPVPVVRDRLGEAIGYAYAAAGGTALFNGDETGKAIARREFQKALEDAARRPAAELTVLTAPQPLPQLTSGQ